MGQIFSLYIGFSLPVTVPPMLNTCSSLWSGTVGISSMELRLTSMLELVKLVAVLRELLSPHY